MICLCAFHVASQCEACWPEVLLAFLACFRTSRIFVFGLLLCIDPRHPTSHWGHTGAHLDLVRCLSELPQPNPLTNL